MKITLELPSDVETQLRDRVAQQDSEAVRRLLADALVLPLESLLWEPEELSPEEFEANLDQMAEVGGAAVPSLSDRAVSRAGIYEDDPDR